MPVRFVQMQNLFVPTRGHCQCLTRQYFDWRHTSTIHRRGSYRCFAVPVIVIFQIFEYVADVQKRISIQADVHECGLHARQDARYFSFVDAADERKFLFALNVDLD